MNWFTRWAIASATATLFTPLGMASVQADGIVPANDGTGTQVTPADGNYDITGGTPAADDQNLFHSFSEFNLLTGESATFITDPAILNILSRITGGNPSLIDGLLQVSGSNANLFLINPSGILFGPNSALNLQGSFTAVTADQVNFATGAFGTVGTPEYAALVGNPESFSFSLENPGSVVNAGSLRVTPGEAVVLMGGQVLNTGTIAAPGGNVIISAVEGGNLVRITQEGLLLNLEMETLATADPNGALPFSPLALPELLTGSDDAVTADVVTVNPDGTVQLANGASVEAAPGTTTIAGTVETTSTQGGHILILGRELALTTARLDASGTLGGGQVNIGGNYQGQGPLPRAQATQVDGNSVIAADAIAAGDGGQVIVWADGDTLFQGRILARGGANGGDGGLVETSGRRSVEVEGGTVDASATQGTAGTWLLDPSNINIDPALAATIEAALAGGTNFTASTIEGEPADETGVLPGEGDIFLNSEIDAIATNDATLTLTASRYIQLGEFYEGPPPINIDGGNLVLKLNQESLAEPTNPTITDALDLIGDVTGSRTINLGLGTYQEGFPIAIFEDLTLEGAGAENTVLDGQLEHPVLLVFSPSTVNISGLTVANGQAFEAGAGGIDNAGADVTIVDSIIRDNTTADAGGGIVNSGTITIIDSTLSNNVTGNDAGFGGGAIYNTGSLSVFNTVFSDNTTLTNAGAIYNDALAVAEIIDSTFVGNTVEFGDGGSIFNAGSMDIAGGVLSGNATSFGNGGAIVNDVEATLAITDSLLVDNQTGEFANGGAIANSGLLVIDSSQIGGNLANFGAGLFSTEDSTVIITNSIFEDNVATGGGGALYSINNIDGEGAPVSLTIADSVFINNEADFGGALAINNTLADITNSLFSDNFAVSDGGAILTNSFVEGAIADSDIIANQAGENGGGLFNEGQLSLTNSTVRNNTALGFGGGIDNIGILDVDSSEISGNIANVAGGGLSNDLGVVNLTASTISDNTASFGGGIDNVAGTLAIANSTLSGNLATEGNGGGISNLEDLTFTSELTISNSTLSQNTAALGGGGIRNESFLTLTSSLVSGNAATEGDNLSNIGSLNNGGNNLFGAAGNAGITGATPGSEDIVPLVTVDRILQTTLADNGGPTPTLALLPGSPALNTGSGTSADQRGVAVVDGIRDIGAFESQGFGLSIRDGDAQTATIQQPFGNPLTVIVSSAFGEPVAGGTVDFVSPAAGASAFLSTPIARIGADGTASVTAIANDIAGTYPVIAAIANTDSTVTFNLTNTTDTGPPAPPAASACPAGDCTTLVTATEEPETDTTAGETNRGGGGSEPTYVSAFETFLNVEAAAFRDFDALDRARAITGVAPALVYANFVASPGEVRVAAADSLVTELANADDAAAATTPSPLARRRIPETATATDDAVLELVLVTAGHEPRRFQTGATRAEVLAAVRQLHLELTDRTRRRLDNYLVPAQALYGWLMAPVEGALAAEGIGHVSFILDEGLRSLPLATLHDGEQYIIENYSVGLMPSLSLTDTRIGNIRNASVLAMGASEFSDQPPLPAVPLELEAIDRLWSGEQYLNETFTPERVVQERSEEAYPVLHLATHGQFANGPLDNSYIQFWNRRLSLAELPQLQLSEPAVELLVLSACRTVLGGEEAELGFAGLAVKSGAKTAIAALWQVSDLETAGLMAELYTHLGQVSYKAEALRQAQLAMLRGEVTVQNGNLTWSGGQAPLPPEFSELNFADTRHPFYWSAFTLVGSPW